MQIRELASMPALAPLFAKAMIPSFSTGPARVPEDALRVAGVRQELDRLAAYDQVCGFRVRDEVSPTWLHVLSFPLHVQLLSGSDSSVRLAGVVHVSNTMTLHRPVTSAETLDVSVRVQNLRPHRRGAMLDLVGEISVDGALVWEGVSTYLAPGAHTPGEPEVLDRPAFEPRSPIARWNLPADLGRQYRRVSGDPNPIHTHLLAAKAFGFARPIIHGMWTHARVLSALEARLPQTYTAAVSFAKPILLPATVAAWWSPSRDGWSAAVTTVDGSKPFLTVEIS